VLWHVEDDDSEPEHVPSELELESFSSSSPVVLSVEFELVDEETSASAARPKIISAFSRINGGSPFAHSAAVWFPVASPQQ
jgi:hypothetical protein